MGSTGKEVIPSVFGCADEVALKPEFIIGGVLRVAEGEVVGGGVEWVVDAADELAEGLQTLHLAML